MDLQRGRVGVGAVAVGALERLVLVVLPLVRLEQRQRAGLSSTVHG